MSSAETIDLSLSAAGRLRGTVVLTGTPNAVLYVHGFGSDRKGSKPAAVRAACARRGWSFAVFDFRGHGESSGTLRDLRGSGLQSDIEAIREYLAGRGVQRLFLVGSSMGGWASAWYARNHPQVVRAVALVAPAFRFLQRRWEDIDEATRLAWQQAGSLLFRSPWLDAELDYGLVTERDVFDPDALAAGWQTPALIYHGMHDETVPWLDSLDLVEKTDYLDIELRLLRDGDHRLQAHAETMAEAACCFFGRWWSSGTLPGVHDND